MSKELFVSLTPHETKAAVTEDDQVAEIYYERENEYTLAGSIYKGRVTRVLPGMQSAFVDIGLERDAFLYVSDFFEMEDDQEEFEPVKVPVNRVPVRQSEPHPPAERYDNRGPVEPGPPAPDLAEPDSIPSPIVFEGGFDVLQDQGEDETEPAAVTRQPAAEEEGGRPWRGRGGRRRRGRRGRGFPDSKFVPGGQQDQQQQEAAPPAAEREPTPPSGYQPMVLPGESISKFSQPPSSAPARPEEPPRQESPRPPERRERGYDRDRDRDRGRGRDRDRDQSFGPPPGYQPIILPGESISKYQRMAPPQPAKPVETSSQPHEPFPAAAAAEPPESISAHAAASDAGLEPSVIEPPSFQQEYPETPLTRRAEERAGSRTRGPENEDEARFDRMNVASIFGGPIATRADVPSESSPSISEVESEHDDPPQDSAEARISPPTQAHQHDESRGAHDLAAARSVEETIDEDELEAEDAGLPAGLTEQFDDADFEELEEETLEPGGYRAGRSAEAAGVADDLTEAVEETELDRQALAGYEGEGEESEEGDVGEEGEPGEAGAEPGAENGNLDDAGPNGGRAEQRASAGTAGYQQRAQRVPFERRGRGRRGGRRMRGGPRQMQRQQVMISDVLKEGQEVLVQIAKEPIGKKGARITSHIALPGRFLVYMPTVNHIGVSRKIASDEERLRLKRIVMGERDVPGHGGFIVRTAAEGVAEDELKADIRFLKGLWNEIKTRADNGKSPALIYHDLNLVERLLRDQLTEDFTHVWVDNEAEYERILRFVNRFQPNLVRRVRLYTKETPLFEQFGIQEEINKALKSKVWLKSGGYIVINQTEALVAIDVNTGKYVGKTQRLEDTIVKTNVDAIKEIVRQIRLRDLGGIIVIDFIDMDERKNRQKVMQALEEALKGDRAPSKVLQFNDFGLVAITRKRVKHSLERTLGNPCPYCTGTGLVKSVETVCNEIYVEMKKMRRQFEGREVLLRVNPEVAKALKGNNARWLNDLEELTGKTIIVKADPTLHQEQFDI